MISISTSKRDFETLAVQLRELDDLCFPEDEVHEFGKEDIIVTARANGALVGYLTILHDGFVARVGVHPAWRGRGLQRRMIKRGVRLARNLGVECIETYTLHNPEGCLSAVNFVLCGFQIDAKQRDYLTLTYQGELHV